MKCFSFRLRLMLYGIFLTLIVATPAALQLGKRPWELLDARIAQGHTLLGSLNVSLDGQELSRMNRFALEMVDLVATRLAGVDAGRESDDYYPLVAPGQAFNFYITHDQSIDEETLLLLFERERLRYTSFSYTRFSEWYLFWRDELGKHPGLRESFARYKRLMAALVDEAGQRGYTISDLYIMLDRGQQAEGFFNQNIAFLLESLPWWESAYPGQPYNLVDTDTLYWRASYDRNQGGTPGYNHNPTSDPDNHYLPRFDTDDWGTWFTLWFTRESTDDAAGAPLYNPLSIDFDATAVQRSMVDVIVALLAWGGALALLITLLAHLISVRITRPIQALVSGAETVMRHEQAEVIPAMGSRELRHLIEVFNQMVRWVGEMVNLRESLSKLLSDELAEKAAKEGLVLGGQSVECTILFTDFAAFSALSQQMDAHQLVGLLNRYFGELIPIVKGHNGFPDKYIGDAIVAIFGAPVPYANHAEQAVQAAIAMQRRLRVLNEMIRQEHGVVFEMRIGINSGEVIVGAIGCDMKLEYTSIGDTTNLANRMESSCPVGHLMITEATFEQVKEVRFENVRFERHPQGVWIKGFQAPITAYEVHIDDLQIETPTACDDPRDFYRYTRVPHGHTIAT